jgi:CelD/BcsL family acetyltransferase involved in cellulose biosynthesis
MIDIDGTNPPLPEERMHTHLSYHSYASFEEIMEMQPEWDGFIESIGGEIFLSFDWCRVWWKHYGKNRELHVFIYWDGDKIVAILPIFYERIRLGLIAVKALKIVGSDFTLSQFSVPVDKDYIRPVMKAFRIQLAAYDFDIFHIGPIAGAYKELQDIYDGITEVFDDSYSVLLKKTNVQTYYKMESDFNAQLAGLSKNERTNIKQLYTKLGKVMKGENGAAQTKLANQENVDESFDLFVQMHQSHWKQLGKAGHFGDWPGSYEFHRELARTNLKHDRLRLLICRWGEYELGYEYIYKFGDMYLQFLNARSALALFTGVSLGKYTEMEMFKKGIEEKIRTIDSMRGRYEYKLRMGGELCDIHGISLVPKKKIIQEKVYLFLFFAGLLNILYYKIWYCRIAPRLPFRRHPLWRVWICSQL